MDSNYKKMAVMLSLNAVIMFLLTYSLIDTFDHFYPNLNRAYMAIIMVCPMALVMMFFMGSMYKDIKLNRVLYVIFAGLFVGTFFLARSQTGVDNEMFLRSMIPHHSSAILMCEHATITDPEIMKLCDGIVKAQKKEISQMKDILKRY
jgi:CDP-diglyceride synthetase